ncbi:SUF system Fe-S cluster assembly protein [Marinivivus vitaminiproducens]|uniref:SUF system Fe-S cluster assembly protein n=1 Tax=Marinivivus vitaminiproducens TaxID=3035935 RepID=UPI00279A54FE|nr:SUF system Fe-S cluster assembly protein [Geminicoccaceae bacterium SCSIO 64248]
MSERNEDRALDQAEAFLNQADEGAPTPERLAEVQAIGEGVIEALKGVYDPEIPVNIYELGLIYKIDIDDGNVVSVAMTLTSPACPVAGSLPGEVEEKVSRVDGVSAAKVDVVWDPPWNPSMMSEEAQLELGMM